ncbi:MAG: hypothetical protein Q8N53_11310, partial [Longimicrobiales bacterium]|nr:hypothetical protein [Longimicrobiales bacterium]
GAGGGVAWHTPEGGIPDPRSQGNGYRTWIGPGLSYEATPSRTTSGLVTLRWRSARGESVAFEARYDRATVRASDVTLPLAPEGSRGVWNMAVRWAW